MDLTIHTRVSNARVYEELKGIQGVTFVASLILHVLSCICIFVNCELSTEDQNDVKCAKYQSLFWCYFIARNNQFIYHICTVLSLQMKIYVTDHY